MMLLLQMILMVVAREVNEALRNLDLGSKALAGLTIRSWMMMTTNTTTRDNHDDDVCVDPLCHGIIIISRRPSKCECFSLNTNDCQKVAPSLSS